MLVPPGDILCRFIDPKHWSDDDKRPAASAFRPSKERGSHTWKLSMWHQDRIVKSGIQLGDLCIDSLTGFGEALITTREILDAAEESFSPVFRPQAVWRPGEAMPPLDAWANAHINIESKRPSSGFPDDFRLLLASRCYVSRPPERNQG